MPRLIKPTAAELHRRRSALLDEIDAGGLPWPEAVRRMRHSLGMTQARYGQVFKLTTRQVWEIENGRANPSLAIMERLAKPLGYRIGVIAGDQEV